MIQFIELVPVEVENPNYEEEMHDYNNASFTDALLMQAPEAKVLRHENKLIAEYEGPYILFHIDEILKIEDEYYIVTVIGPKEFSDTFVQSIYVKKR